MIILQRYFSSSSNLWQYRVLDYLDDDDDSPSEDEEGEAWEKVMEEYGCCGVDGYEDWQVTNRKICGE